MHSFPFVRLEGGLRKIRLGVERESAIPIMFEGVLKKKKLMEG